MQELGTMTVDNAVRGLAIIAKCKTEEERHLLLEYVKLREKRKNTPSYCCVCGSEGSVQKQKSEKPTSNWYLFTCSNCHHTYTITRPEVREVTHSDRVVALAVKLLEATFHENNLGTNYLSEILKVPKNTLVQAKVWLFSALQNKRALSLPQHWIYKNAFLGILRHQWCDCSLNRFVSLWSSKGNGITGKDQIRLLAGKLVCRCNASELQMLTNYLYEKIANGVCYAPISACPSCGGTEALPCGDVVFFPNAVICCKCGTLFAPPRVATPSFTGLMQLPKKDALRQIHDLLAGVGLTAEKAKILGRSGAYVSSLAYALSILLCQLTFQIDQLPEDITRVLIRAKKREYTDETLVRLLHYTLPTTGYSMGSGERGRPRKTKSPLLVDSMG